VRLDNLFCRVTLSYAVQVFTLALIMTPDLPLEIWMNVASHLPQGYIRTLLAVNRPLFHLAMEDRYERFEATTADLRTLERIQYTSAFSVLNYMSYHIMAGRLSVPNI
jgi:hypothetical protein